MSVASGPIKRPILTLMIYLIVITIGVVSLTRLPIDLLPEITYPTITVSAGYSNVGPEEIEDLITRPLEEALSAIQGVEEITSTSSEGRSTVRVSFTWGTNLDAAVNDIRDRIDRIMGRLPADIDRPSIRKFDLSAVPIIILGVGGDLNPLQLREMVEDRVKYRLERVPGVAAVDIWGGLMREIHIRLNADKLRAHSVSINEITTALRNENQNIPTGTYTSGNIDIFVKTSGQYASLDEIRNTPVAVRSGALIKIQDLASVEDSWQEITRIVRLNGNPGLRIAINKQSGYNSVKVANDAIKEIERINADHPQIELLVIRDTSEYIKSSISNMGWAAIFGGVLAIVILLLFLRNLPSTLVVATAIPISILATFAVMYFGGFTLNLMTFGGLALGIGMLVDNAIVVLENIYRHRERGKEVIASALDGTQEVSAAIIASTLTTLVVFAPVVFIRGMSGILFQQLALVVCFALICSVVVSLTLVPLMASKILKINSRGFNENSYAKNFLTRFFAISKVAQDWLVDRYSRILDWSLNNRTAVIVYALGLFLLSFALMGTLGVELMPTSDEGEVRVDIEMAVGTSLDLISSVTERVEEIVRRETPEVQHIQTTAGGFGWRGGGGHRGDVRVTLIPMNERKRSSEEIQLNLENAIRKEVIPGAVIRVRSGSGMFAMRALSSGSDDRLSIEIRGHDLATGMHLAEQVQLAVQDVEGVTDTRISRDDGRPEVIIRVDRLKAAEMGIPLSTIGNTLQAAVGGTYASSYQVGGRDYQILVRLREEDRMRLEDILDLTVSNSRGQSVQLRNIVYLHSATGPVDIERIDQERTIQVTANYAGRDLGSVVRDVRSGLAQIPVPSEFVILVRGDWEAQREAFTELMLAILLAILLIYMVLAGQFESFKYPFVVMFSVPMAFIGVVGILKLTGTPVTINAFIGMIMLAGIVVNNAILLVDYTNRLRRRDGMQLREAIMTASSRRMRPIIMTALTTILGMIPLSLGFGEGGETQAPLARVVIGGLMSSTLITLILIPVIYSFSKKIKAED